VDSDRPMTLLLGDLDADGDLDLVIGNAQQQNRLYLNNGTGRYSDATLGRMPARSDATTSLALGDIDNDGDLDLVVGNGAISLGQANRLYLNSGTASFSDVTATRLPLDSDFTVALAVGDVDADGDLDLVAANADYQDRLYKNLHRQLDAPFALRVGRTYQLDVYSRFGPSTTTELAFAFLSTGTAKIPLPPRGTLGIDPAFAISLPPFVVSQPAGLGSLTLLIPNQASLAGVPIYSQVLLVQQPVQERLTNVIGDIILR
ncbi:MAG TPA: VCBS repeat-containing protein, partial [Planctomycetota bacterium]|nr:VCBS repeat-containing protein [Planctomycetota bacterium]